MAAATSDIGLLGLWRDQGEQVFVTTRRSARANELRRESFEPVVLDVTQTQPVSLPTVDTVVFAVGFDRSEKHSIFDVYVSGLQRIVEVCPPTIRRFLYISSTGVYGQTDGGWVDESSPCNPNRDGGKACLAAESFLRQSQFRESLTILRLAGIYGPGRLPQLTKLREGNELLVAEDAYLNLIHVEDAVRIAAACEAAHSSAPLLCVSDGKPVQRGDFYRLAAELLELPEPRFRPPPAGSSRAERSRGSKRISNKLLVDTLVSIGLEPLFLYPTYREGLRSILASDIHTRGG